MAAKDPVDDLALRVAEARPQDVGRGIIRIDPEIIEKRGWGTGDIIRVEGTRTTAGILWPGYPQDRGSGQVRMDGMLRRNAKTSIGEVVKLAPMHANPGTQVALRSTEGLHIRDAEEYLREYFAGRVLSKGDVVELAVMGRRLEFEVAKVDPPGTVLVNDATAFVLKEPLLPGQESKEAALPKVTYEDLGGMGDAIKRVREMIELPLRHPEIFERLGVEAPKGVLLHGPPGTGKTLLAKAVANESGASFYHIGGPEIMSKFYGQSEENLRDVFKQAGENAPAIIFIDELDSIAPSREEVTGEVERRVVAQLLSVMDGLASRGKVVVIGATNRLNSIDIALRRPGRFDREIEIGVPDRDGRKEILQIHTRGMPLTESVDLDSLADRTHGFVGADIAALAKEAALRSVRRVLPEVDLQAQEIPAELLNKLIVDPGDFESALNELEPSALREVFVQRPNVKWSDVGGLDEVKQALIESVEWPLKHAEEFAHYKAKAPKGFLLYGPPGTGKTLLAKAVATESEANFISVKGPEFLSKWVGESEKAVREVFRKARQAAPCIVFFDELDSLAPTRGAHSDSGVTERVISQLLTEMDGMQQLTGVTVIGATNRPDLIDPALRRPGRFDRVIEVPNPDEGARETILRIHSREMPLDTDVDAAEWARRTGGWSGADVAQLPQDAALHALRTHIEAKKGKPGAKALITAADVEWAYENMKKQHQIAPGQAYV